jgi:hypothetical protein
MNLPHFLYAVFNSDTLRQLALSWLCLLLLGLTSANAGSPDSGGESKRIEVYPLSQNFHDVEAGDTLQQIALQLLPNRPAQRTQLMRDIVQLNPTAFVKQNPDRLKAGARLWLPNNQPHYVPKHKTGSTHIESFSWGQVIHH